MTLLTEKYIRPTIKNHGHTKLYYNNNYIGHIIIDYSKYRTIDHNWHFVPAEQTRIFPYVASNRKAILQLIINELKGI